MERKRFYLPHKNKMRNLVQFRDMTDDDFEEYWAENYENVDEIPFDFEDLERRIEEKIEELSKDYDLDDMKANDMMQLRSLILSVVQLEDLESKDFEIRQDINSANVLTLEKINRMISALKTDVSALSTDLQLTKKIRNKSKEVSVAKRWNDLVDQAYEFAKRKMLYIFCPECNMLLATVWLLYTDEPYSSLSLHCGKCGNHFTEELSSLYEMGNKNL